MNQPPVLFFAFANEEGRFLEYLKRESTAVHQALLPVDAKGFIKVVREESTETNDLFRFFQAYRGRMAVFHFAGHANGQQLNLEDQATGMHQLAQLLAEQKDSLRLVFLNGCATAGQVERLHQLGIPVVIATRCAVDDPRAQAFATRFYGALANHYSLEGAFLHAKTHLEIKYKESPNIFLSSGSGQMQMKGGQRDMFIPDLLTDGNQPEADSFPWGMYIAEGAAAGILQWKLPQYYSAPAPASVQVSYAVNKNILRLLKAVKSKAPHLREENYPTEEALIITSFPWIISVHLFRLFADAESMSVVGLARLRELIQAYVSTTRFLSYIALSQLWDELKAGKLNLQNELEEFFLLHKSNSKTYDYLLLLQRVCENLEGGNIEWFMPELKVIAERWAPGSHAFDQYRYVEAIRQRLLQEDIPAQEVEEGCYLCESVLTDLLTQAAGLVNFSLITVRDIRIINPGHIAVPTPFEHMIGDLHVPFQAYLKHRPRSLEQYINSHSVVLTQRDGKNRINKYLNLSPFYLDKTAFGDSKGKNTPMIYTLHHWEADTFVFQNVNYNINQAGQQNSLSSIDFFIVRPEMEDYQIIREQMDSFIKDIGG